MRNKDSTVKTDNLNPIFDKPLKKFDLLHQNMMGNEAVVTSVDTGGHWGSIKKENRPDGWEEFGEYAVRHLSDSKHYDDPCNALDFRRRNPDTDSDLNYYDDLTESEQRYFMEKMYECFPDELFDIVFSRLCIHCEWDPKLEHRKSTNDENRTDDDLDPQEPDGGIPKVTKEAKQIKAIQRKIVVTELDKMWLYLDRSSVIMGSINFITKRLTGLAWFKDKLKIGKDQSLIQRLIELINTIISKLKGK